MTSKVYFQNDLLAAESAEMTKFCKSVHISRTDSLKIYVKCMICSMGLEYTNDMSSYTAFGIYTTIC